MRADDLAVENARLRHAVGELEWKLGALQAQLRDAQSLNRALKTAHEELQQVFTESARLERRH